MSIPTVVLASASAIRGRILDGAGIEHVRDPADIDENTIKQRLLSGNKGAAAIAEALAEAKARAVTARHPEAIVIGADQILELDGRLFDKPADMAAARETLTALRGRTHRLVSAVAVIRHGDVAWRHVEDARLTVRDFSDTFLNDYLKTGGPGILESVGAYRLESTGAQLFETIEGDYFTILGLPLLALLGYLRGAGAVRE